MDSKQKNKHNNHNYKDFNYSKKEQILHATLQACQIYDKKFLIARRHKTMNALEMYQKAKSIYDKLSEYKVHVMIGDCYIDPEENLEVFKHRTDKIKFMPQKQEPFKNQVNSKELPKKQLNKALLLSQQQYQYQNKCQKLINEGDYFEIYEGRSLIEKQKSVNSEIKTKEINKQKLSKKQKKQLKKLKKQDQKIYYNQKQTEASKQQSFQNCKGKDFLNWKKNNLKMQIPMNKCNFQSIFNYQKHKQSQQNFQNKKLNIKRFQIFSKSQNTLKEQKTDNQSKKKIISLNKQQSFLKKDQKNEKIVFQKDSYQSIESQTNFQKNENKKQEKIVVNNPQQIHSKDQKKEEKVKSDSANSFSLQYPQEYFESKPSLKEQQKSIFNILIKKNQSKSKNCIQKALTKINYVNKKVQSQIKNNQNKK